MKTGPDGLALIRHYESCVLKAYPDPATGGHPWTIGVGHCGPEVKPGMTLTQAEAEALLALDLARFELGIADMLTDVVSQHQHDALVSLGFNIGLGNLRKSTLIKRVNEGNEKAAQAEFLRWNLAAGKVMRGLQRRRKAESLVFSGMAAEIAIREALKAYP